MEVDQDEDIADNLLAQIGKLAEECLLPKLDSVAEEITDWTVFVKQANLILKLDQILLLLKSLISVKSHTSSIPMKDKQFLVPLIVLVGEQRDRNKPWSSEGLVTKCNSALAAICALFRGAESSNPDEDLSNLFREDLRSAVVPKKTLFFFCLQNLRQKLRPNVWKQFPGAIASFSWIVTKLKHPFLSDFTGDILSPTLLLLDDYNDENKIVGIRLASYALKNLNKADLLRDNWALVLQNALLGLLYDKNPTVINGVVPLLISTLKIVEVDPNKNSHKFTKYDDTIKKILFALDTSTERELKTALVVQLTSYLEVLGHATLHWNSKVCESLIILTTTNDPDLWKALLNCLRVQIKNTWLKPQSEKIAEILLRIVLNCSVLDFSNISKQEREAIIQEAREIIKLLEGVSDYDNVRSEIEQMKQCAELHKDFKAALQAF